MRYQTSFLFEMALLAAVAAASHMLACSDPQDTVLAPSLGSGAGGSRVAGATGGSGGAPGNEDSGLQPFTPPPLTPPPATALVTASGEILALQGYAFPPVSPDDPVFVDGWDLKFQHVIFTLTRVQLSDNPDVAPGDQSQTGNVVAQATGPWAIDLSQDAVTNVNGQGDPGERAVPVALIANQTQNANAPFATDGTRYAFSYDVGVATAQAQNVNLGPEGQKQYQQMISEGCSVLYVGTATFQGTSCSPSDAEFAQLPTTVNFRFCFQTPTSYLNCQNGKNDPAAPFANEEHQRGVSFKQNTYTTAQITLHTDHPFWDSTRHDTPAHFDPIAARAKPGSNGAPATVSLDDLKGADFTAFKDAQGQTLRWRSCVSTYTPPASGPMYFDPASVARTTPTGDPAAGLRDYADFISYNQSTQGHLNVEDGLCATQRNYPSPR